MRVLLVTIGSGGDVNPYVAIGRALRARGHEAVVMTNPHFRSRVEGAGLGFIALGTEEEYLAAVRSPDLVHPGRGPRFVINELVVRHTPAMFEATGEAIRALNPAVVVRHLIAFGAEWAAQRAGVPTACGVLGPGFWLSTREPLVLRRWTPSVQPTWLRRVAVAAGMQMARWRFDPSINAARRGLGLDPLRDAFVSQILGGDRSLGLWSPAFRGPLPGDPGHGVICGFTWFDGDGSANPDAEAIERFLASGEPPIVFTLGTSVVHHGRDFYPLAAEACRRLGRRGLLLVGPAENRPARLPSGVEAFGYAPFTNLLNRAAATVHHGGIGTTAQGLRSGRPTVIVPFANDEFDNAARAQRLGVSATVHTNRLSVDSLERALRSVLEDPRAGERAARLAPALAAEDGADGAAAEAERLAQAAPPRFGTTERPAAAPDLTDRGRTPLANGDCSQAESTARAGASLG